mmetsp:Transcript_109059/g.326192  ORF Transcript_109059/g.326192 Transcript_109059/m.326192 type:complete len:243 (-) Transcript_109059:76-804(-)
MGGLVTTLAFPVPPKEFGRQRLEARPDLLFLNTANGLRISAVHIKKNSSKTILYSHGNAEDLGQILHYIDHMADTCGVDVFAYDYCGYGLSEGDPSEENCYQSINAAYDHLKRQVRPARIVAFGRSIGSGPTVDLVSRHPEISGMVLQSPLESGGRAVLGYGVSTVFYRMDIFRNYEKVDKVECPVLVMHGTNDAVVPHANGVAIHGACKRAVEPLWVEGRGHNDMPDYTCLKRVREFLEKI